jgi:hypothetical protein
MIQPEPCPACPDCVPPCPGRGRVTVSRVSHPLQGGHAQDTLDTDTQTPRPRPDVDTPASYQVDPVRLMSDEAFAAWMKADNAHRDALMAAGTQRLELARQHRRRRGGGRVA